MLLGCGGERRGGRGDPKNPHFGRGQEGGKAWRASFTSTPSSLRPLAPSLPSKCDCSESEPCGGRCFMGKDGPPRAEDVLAPLRTHRVVVESAAGVQGPGADLCAGAEKKQRPHSGLQARLCWALTAVQPWGSYSVPLVPLPSPSLFFQPHLCLPRRISHSHNICTPRRSAKRTPKAPGPSAPHRRRAPAPRPRPHLWKAPRQHWNTSKLLLLRVAFKRVVQSTPAPLGTYRIPAQGK